MSAGGTTPRQDIAAQIKADCPRWIVQDYPFTPSTVTARRPVVSVFRPDLGPGPKQYTLKHELTINLYGDATAGAKAEALLDDYLDEVMLSLERVPGFKFDKATRMTYRDETIAGWQITGSVISPNVYRVAVLEEKSKP